MMRKSIQIANNFEIGRFSTFIQLQMELEVMFEKMCLIIFCSRMHIYNMDSA